MAKVQLKKTYGSNTKSTVQKKNEPQANLSVPRQTKTTNVLQKLSLGSGVQTKEDSSIQRMEPPEEEVQTKEDSSIQRMGEQEQEEM